MASHRAPDYRTLASLSRVRLLNALAESGFLTIEELAEATGLHPNTTREHLHRLIDAGYVRSRTQPGSTPGRPKLTYTSEVDRDDPVQVEKLRGATRRAEYTRWLLPMASKTDEPTAMSQQLDVLEDHFDQCGFDATVDTGAGHITVYKCPFESLARQNPEVCQAHYHLIDLALQRVDGPLGVDSLHRLDPVNGCSIDLHCERANADSAAAETQNPLIGARRDVVDRE